MLGPETVGRLGAILRAETDSFVELGRIAGLDPATAYIGADLSGCDFGDDDLSGFVFHRADLRGANLASARGLEARMFEGAEWDADTA